MEEKIYFDNGSTSWPKAPGVQEAVSELLKNGAFNINRGNYAGAYEVESVVLETRDQLVQLFHGTDSRNVIFTPGITYSLNYFIKGFLKNGDHVLVSGLEHNAVMRPLEQMKLAGVDYDIVPVDEEGNLDPEDLRERIRINTKAVIMTHASNVCGTVVPIREIGSICKEYGLFFAVDTAQSAGTLPVDMQECQIDFLAFTAHKGLLGPQGIGGFLISERLDKELTEYLLNEVKRIPQVRIVGRKDVQDRVAVVSLDFLTIDNAVAAFELEQECGVMTRVGLHCAPAAHQSLHTFPQGTVRFAFSASNTFSEIDRCVEGILKIL